MERKLKISNLAKQQMSKKTLNMIKGGCCICGCRGSSSNGSNGGANAAHGLVPADGGGGTLYGC